MCIDSGMEMAIMHYDDSTTSFPAIVSCTEMMESFVPETLFWDGDGSKEPNLASLDTWLVILLKADYTRGSQMQLNHWVPAYTRLQLGDSEFDSRADISIKKVARSLQKAQKRLLEAEESDDEIAASMETHVHYLLNKQEFLQTMIRGDVLPIEVPADGNCACWTVLHQKAGPNIGLNLATKEKVKDLRHATWIPRGNPVERCSHMLDHVGAYWRVMEDILC